nr:zonular occludens toxin domain-containing protein [uncultured Acetatifactor sp.]
MTCFLLAFLALLVFCAVMARKYRNPYKLTLVFGKKGSGKTTFLTKKAVQYMRRGKTVYSTVYIPGAHMFDVQQIGNYTFPPESVVFVDEVGMVWDNRNFKSFRPEVRDWFKLQRHYHVTVWLFSQATDIDIKLRMLMDEMYLCTCHMNFLSVARKIRRSITIVHPSGDAEARIADDINFVPVWYSLFGAKSAVFTYIPNWVKYFDSFDAPELPLVDSEFQQVPDPLSGYYQKFSLRRRLFQVLQLVRFLKARRPAALARGGRARRRKRDSDDSAAP